MIRISQEKSDSGSQTFGAKTHYDTDQEFKAHQLKVEVDDYEKCHTNIITRILYILGY